ncbi:hypothetical protein [Thalassotalea sp. PLHSN55]|uniref:hypothetical protein n=1 Tax=Thalassotalea sp. PLHSN55 TaxID=3435888 RepID=UPI003F84943B
MELISDIVNGFNLSDNDLVSDSFISENEDLMWIKSEINLMHYVPSYMIWCIKYNNSADNLVCDYTINALAEYGRRKETSSNYLNFKSKCSPKQTVIIVQFLNWCLNNLLICDKEQIERSIKRWQ